MARERKTMALLALGLLWLILAVSNAIMIQGAPARVVSLVSYGATSLLAGLFLGRAVQKIQSRSQKPLP